MRLALMLGVAFRVPVRHLSARATIAPSCLMELVALPNQVALIPAHAILIASMWTPKSWLRTKSGLSFKTSTRVNTKRFQRDNWPTHLPASCSRHGPRDEVLHYEKLAGVTSSYQA